MYVHIGLIDYIDLITFSDLFNYGKLKSAIDKFSDYFQMDNENLIKENKIYVDPLLAFLKNADSNFIHIYVYGNIYIKIQIDYIISI